ncbi:MAG: hypothetical protein J6U64_04940, partial [Alphaproteobacteria bacterium]|nr:hypothetical protein [Alphaproteobacteria bacterium]
MKKILIILMLFVLCTTNADASCPKLSALDSVVTPLSINARLGIVSGTNAKKKEDNKKEAAIMFLEDFAYRKLFQQLDKNYYECLKSGDPDVFIIEKAETILGSLAESKAKKYTDDNIWGGASLPELKTEINILRKDKTSDSRNYAYTNPKMSVKNIGAYPEIVVDKTGVPPIDDPSPKMKEGVRNMKIYRRNQARAEQGKRSKFTKKDEVIAIIEPFIMVKSAVDNVGATRETNKRLWFKQRHVISSMALALYLKVELQKLHKIFDLVKNLDTLNDGTQYSKKDKYKVPVNDWNEDLVIHAQLWNIFNRLLVLNQQIKTARLGVLPGEGIVQAAASHEFVITDDEVSGWEQTQSATSTAGAGDKIYSKPEWDLPWAEKEDVNFGGGNVSGESGAASGGGGGGGSEEETETDNCFVYLDIYLGGDYSAADF